MDPDLSAHSDYFKYIGVDMINVNGKHVGFRCELPNLRGSEKAPSMYPALFCNSRFADARSPISSTTRSSLSSADQLGSIRPSCPPPILEDQFRRVFGRHTEQTEWWRESRW